MNNSTETKVLSLHDLFQNLDTTSKTVGACTVLLVALAAMSRFCQKCYRWFWPKMQSWGKNMAMAEDLRRNFGDDVGGKLRDILTKYSVTIGQLEMRLTTLETQAGIGVYACDANTGECRVSNPVLAEMFGLSREEMKGWGWTVAVVNAEAVRQKWITACRLGVPYHDTYEVENQRTKERFFVQTAAYLPNDPYDSTTYSGWVKRVETNVRKK